MAESYDPSYYEVLGVPENASDSTIAKAFTREMRHAHPDRYRDEPADIRREAEERSRLLTEAHRTLTGEDRAGYDARLRERRGTPSGLPTQDADAVLRLTRARWQRGGRLVPESGGDPIEIPARVPHGEVLVFPRRGQGGDLRVRVLHVDGRGRQMDEGHRSGSGLAEAVRGMSPFAAAGAAVGVLLVVIALVVLAGVLL